MDEKKLSASLKVAINKWVESACSSTEWIDTLFPEEGVDLMVDAAMAVLKAIEASSKFTESEHVD